MRRLRCHGPCYIELDISVAHWSERSRLTSQADSALRLAVPRFLSTVIVLLPRPVLAAGRTAPLTPADIVLIDKTLFRVAP